MLKPKIKHTTVLEHLLFFNSKHLLLEKNGSIYPFYFNKTVYGYNGKNIIQRKCFFLHNTLKTRDLFLTNKPKPMPFTNIK